MSSFIKKNTSINITEKHLVRILDSIADPVFVKDRNHRWVYLNESYCQFMGYRYEELIGKTDYDYFPEAQADVFWQKDEVVFKSGNDNVNEEEFTDSSGTLHIISTKKTLYTNDDGAQFIVGVIRDVTQIKRLEKELRWSQKLETIGRLSGGLAHDFNNIMMVITGYSEILAETLQETNLEAYHDLMEIQRATKRASNLVNQLLTISRKQKINSNYCNLSLVVDQSRALIQKLLRGNIKAHFDLSEINSSVLVDLDQINQVLLNLITNAQDAMPEGGEITLETEEEFISASNPHLGPGLKAGLYCVVRIHDTGEGLDEGELERIFEPFFTSKTRGKGSGLGLATSLSIIKQAGGHLTVENEPVRGVTFSIYLPAYPASLTPLPKAPSLPPLRVQPSPPVEIAGDDPSPCVLIADDETGIRRILSQSLRRAGYRLVLEARDGEEALEILKARGDAGLDLLITDVIMPNMGGVELQRRLSERYPGLKTVFISGYADEALNDIPATAPFLQKPFAPTRLIQLLARLGV